MGDYYDRRSRDYPQDDRREGRRRFDKYRVTGMLLLFFGIAILALGIFDVAWTVSRYGNNCQEDPSGTYNLCTGNHVYVYVGSSLWGGALLILAAYLALSAHPDKAHHRQTHRIFLFFMVLHTLVVMPAVIVLNVLEIVFGKTYFWVVDSNGSIHMYDSLQFGMPLAIAILASMALNVCLFFCVIVYCCSEDKSRYYKRQRYYERGYDGPEEEESYRGRNYPPPPRNPYAFRYGYPGGYPGYGGGRRAYYN